MYSFTLNEVTVIIMFVKSSNIFCRNKEFCAIVKVSDFFAEFLPFRHFVTSYVA